MKRVRYELYGAVLGAGLPFFATFIEALRQSGSLAPGALARAHASQPLLWIMDTTPLVLGVLGWVISRQRDVLVRQSAELVAKSEEIVRLEQARRASFDHTASELFETAQGLLGNVSSFTSTTAQTAATVRQTTATMSQLSQAATAAALTAETVIGLALQAERVSEQGLEHAQRSHAELLRLADEVRELSARIEALNERMTHVFEIADVVGGVAERSQAMAAAARERAARAGAGAAGELLALAEEVGAEAYSAAAAALRVKTILSDAHKAMLQAMTAAELGSRRARSGAQVVTQNAETIQSLASTLRESSRAAREIARVAQQQENGIEQVLKAMNEIYIATEDTVASTQSVAEEARSLNELASELRSATKR